MMPRISGATLDAMRAVIAPLDTAERRQRYLAGDFTNSARVIDLDKRYRWDLLWDSNATNTLRLYVIEDNLNDAHIDTALRSIVPTLGKGEA